jgi:hypothetical protein
MRIASFIAAAALAGGLVACAGNPEPGEPGYAFNLNGEYDVEFLADDGQAYTGTMELETVAGGAVTGVMALRSPATVDGSVEGLIIGAELSITVPYAIVENGCGGVASGSGIIAEGGGSVTGDVDINDECQGAPFSATFTLTLPSP